MSKQVLKWNLASAKRAYRAQQEVAEEFAEQLRAIQSLHSRRPWQHGKDPIHFGQTVFPDLCDHDRETWPCATARAIGRTDTEAGHRAFTEGPSERLQAFAESVNTIAAGMSYQATLLGLHPTGGTVESVARQWRQSVAELQELVRSAREGS